MTTTTCRDCGAPVVFARNIDTGGRMILNVAIDLERGNVLVDPRGDEPRCRVVDGDEARRQRAFGTATYLSHHATCPEADRWRRRRRRRGPQR
jgi:hypothetical protein